MNKSWGAHGHHEIRELDGQAVERSVQNDHDAMASINAIMAPSRRQMNSYCADASSYDLERMWSCDTILQIASAVSYSRYRKVNLASYPKYGTLELRQHRGSVEAVKLIAWVKFGQALLEASKAGRIVSHRNDFLPVDLIAYYDGREAQFAARAA